jgi:hypothetical protein
MFCRPLPGQIPRPQATVAARLRARRRVWLRDVLRQVGARRRLSGRPAGAVYDLNCSTDQSAVFWRGRDAARGCGRSGGLRRPDTTARHRHRAHPQARLSGRAAHGRRAWTGSRTVARVLGANDTAIDAAITPLIRREELRALPGGRAFLKDWQNWGTMRSDASAQKEEQS